MLASSSNTVQNQGPDTGEASQARLLSKQQCHPPSRRQHQLIGSQIFGQTSFGNFQVSRGSGGKDCHSEVLTSKGLRDRRVRLSVPTAIQFYDLQDQLGCDQSSKAVDWLIQVAADAIAELPLLSLAASARTLFAVAASASLPLCR
ncbi:hypothetical protein MRB53_034945 [Persea americana]|uniref:Uncharacterized protein n=1 Tax=Persea americana TaxID=3435 RepID=A0ACC2K3I1_PERAE|nr:hypothetical protein MRB53_034945 [Persea americana]